MDIINVNDVCLTLGKTEILKHINVSFEEGKIHGLIGRNGSGKDNADEVHMRLYQAHDRVRLSLTASRWARTLTSRKIWE